ncbi:MAG: serine/threonine-protein phosphatase [Ignavibacteriaceae bacterium]|nr:serine/threonine-protein phosphatase [Ignavibacteriaceae bacterium]
MNQKKLHRTVETIASQKFENEEAMLIKVLNQIVENEKINVIGGRLWKLNADTKCYTILYQIGAFEKLTPDFNIAIDDYPFFDLIAKERTILGSETNEILRSKGIFRYSASGVGSKLKVSGKPYFEYLLALNSEHINEEFKLTLNIIATALTSQIKQRRYSKSTNTLLADIDKARQLQKSILPEHEYNFSNYELFGITDPAEIVGGDFFDYLKAGDDSDRLGVVVGDAASKGIAAAAEAMYISGALRMASSFEIKIAPLMKRMNKLVNKIFADDKFASLFYGELSTDKSGLFLYANAGHNPPMFIRADSDTIEYLSITGPVLGPAPKANYTIENINFGIGDVLLIYSDGLIDSADGDFEPYGEEKIENIFMSVKHLSAKEITYHLLNDVINFAKNGKYLDDKTIVVIKRVK